MAGLYVLQTQPSAYRQRAGRHRLLHLSPVSGGTGTKGAEWERRNAARYGRNGQRAPADASDVQERDVRVALPPYALFTSKCAISKTQYATAREGRVVPLVSRCCTGSRLVSGQRS